MRWIAFLSKDDKNTDEKSKEDDFTEQNDAEKEKIPRKELRILIKMSETTDASGISNSSDVLYNEDKDRFSQKYTLNLNIFSLYRISMEMDSTVKLMFVSLGRKKYFNILPGNFEKEYFEIVEKAETGKKIYSFVYSTDKVEATERHHRTVLPCSIMFDGCREIKFQLLVNFMCNNNTNEHDLGVPLSQIHLHATFGYIRNEVNISYEWLEELWLRKRKK